MSFFTYHHQFFSSLWDWSGRMRRRDYWMGALCATSLHLVASLLMGLFGFLAFQSRLAGMMGLALLGLMLWLIYTLILWASLVAAQVRRLHDIGRSGWWVGVLAIVSLIIGVVSIFFAHQARPVLQLLQLFFRLLLIGVQQLYLYWLVQDSQGFPNAYGEDPKRGERFVPPGASSSEESR